MSGTQKRLAISAVLICILIIAAVLFQSNSEQSHGSSDKQVVQDGPIAKTHSVNETLGNEWQWPKENTVTEEVTNQVSLPFTPQSVYDALSVVKIDENGDIVLDNEALISLDEALERIYDQLNSEQLNALLNLIKSSLPGKVGEQTAEIVGNYYEFLQAQAQFSEVHEGIDENEDRATVQAVEDDEILYSELQSLRELHLGVDVTDSLFRVSDANAEFMFASLKLEYDTELTDEERFAKREEIQKKHIEQSVDIANWPERYQSFLAAKASIVNASIDDIEKQNQVTSLLQQRFSSVEISRIAYLGLDQI